jgi:hypothetical protein
MDSVNKDDRFASIARDPRFHKMARTYRKTKIDKRFQGMMTDERFKLKYTVDPRGRPINQTSKENLRKFYVLSSSDEDDSDDEEASMEPKAKEKTLKKKTAGRCFVLQLRLVWDCMEFISVKETQKVVDAKNKMKAKSEKAGKLIRCVPLYHAMYEDFFFNIHVCAPCSISTVYCFLSDRITSKPKLEGKQKGVKVKPPSPSESGSYFYFAKFTSFDSFSCWL